MARAFLLSLMLLAAPACSGRTESGPAGSSGSEDAGAPSDDLLALGVLAPPLPNGTACYYVADPTAPQLSRGLVDVALTNEYDPTLLVGTMLQAPGGTGITLESAQIQVVDPTTNETVASESVTATGFIPASGGELSYGTVAIPILGASAIQHFALGPGTPSSQRMQAMTYVRVSGTAVGGQTLQSAALPFAVDLCWGCLVSFPPGVPNVQSYCAGESPSLATSMPCVVGQDQPVDCQVCYALSPSACGG